MRTKLVNGINIQFPISQLILSGKKTIETRTYPIPRSYVGVPVALIETPGRTGEFRSRIVALIEFGNSFAYDSERAFYRDVSKHMVTKNSPWAWTESKPKFGWPVKVLKEFSRPINLDRQPGIKYSKNLEVSF